MNQIPRQPERRPAPDPARHAALRFLAEQAPRFPDLAITPPPTQGLDARDAALAHAIADATLRHWFALRHLASAFLRQPFEALKPPAQGALLAGGAQLLALDRLPPHAVVDHAVGWTKHAAGVGASRVVNAVLRRISEARGEPEPGPWVLQRDALPLPDGRVRPIHASLLPAQASERLHVLTSHSRWLVDRWIASHGLDRASALALHSHAPPPTIVFAPTGAVPPAELSPTPHEEPLHWVVSAPRERLAQSIEAAGSFWVQDPSSTRAVASLPAGLEPRLILDLCAGQGTKTRQLLHAYPRAEILASDPNERRRRALARLGELHPRLRSASPHALDAALDGRRPDLILLDVPCTNTGVLARRTEARLRTDAEQLARLVHVQEEILRRAESLIAPGGHILYATCSLDPEENSQQAAAMQRRGWTLVASQSALPQGLPGSAPAGYRDGSFSALLAPPRPGT